MNISTEPDRDIWHDLQQPGSYEWWYFDAEDREQGLSLVCIWFAGFAFSPYYMKRYQEWRRDGASFDPPLAADHAGFSFQLYENGREVVNFIKEGPASSFEAVRDGIGIRFEKNRFFYDAARDCYALEIDFDFPARRKRVRATLLFEALSRFSYEKRDGNNNGRVPRHEWLLALPRAAVSGSVTLDDTFKKRARTLRLIAEGYHDHNLGVMPVHEYIDKWYWGRAFSPRFDLVYYVIFFRNNGYAPLTLCLMHDNEQGSLDVYEHLDVRQSRGNRGLFAPLHSRELLFAGNGFSMQVRQRRVLDSGPFYLRFNTDISCSMDGEGPREFEGISEFLRPGRLQSPLLQFFTRCRVWRGGEKSLMYDQYNFLKTCFNWFKS